MIARPSALTPKHKADATTIAAYLHKTLDGHVAEFLALVELSGAVRLGTVARELERLHKATKL
jgi:hypothetical protein